MALLSPKESDTTNYTDISSPTPSDAGTLQCGGWANNLASPPWWDFPNEVLEGLPAQVRVQISGSGVAQIGPNQYRVTLSLSGTSTVQLTPTPADAQQNPTTAVLPQTISNSSFGYVSRNINVATVSSTGLVTAVGRGEVEITIRGFRNVNESFLNATPSGTESVDATLDVVVLN
jgi:hypothetical protein